MLGLHRVAERLEHTELAGEVWLFPCLNVHAYMFGARHSPFDLQDMDRVHPGNEAGTVTEQIAFALSTHVLPGSQLVLDVHGGSPENGDIPFAKWRDPAGSTLARSVARAVGVDFVVLQSGDETGMLSKTCASLDVPVVSIEACNAYSPAGANAVEMAGYVERTLQLLEMLPAKVGPASPPPLRATATHRATTGGAFESFVTYGERVTKGQELGVVRNLLGERVQIVHATVAGTVSVMRSGVRVHPGETLCTLSYDVEA